MHKATKIESNNYYKLFQSKKSIFCLEQIKTKSGHIISLFLFLFFHLQCFGQLSFQITKVPENTPNNSTIHIAGDFNAWNAEDTEMQFTSNGDGTYSLTKNLSAGLLEFKLTRGSWETVEGNETGTFLPNRQFNYDGTPQTLEIEILSWEDLGNGGGGLNLPPNVYIMDEDFYMPELDRNRRIWIYLPPDYDMASSKRYRVLYMHDGQNLFTPETSFAGEWEIDETLTKLFEEGDEGCIVVGIDNGEAERIDEYSPWVNVNYGGGEGDEYVDFIVTTLKPYIDQNYRTKTEREYTGIMGSSMGGLISHYAALEYPEVFGKAGIFSPSYWFSGEAYTHVLASGHQEDMRICFLSGGKENGGSVVVDTENMYQTFLDVGFGMDELKNVVKADGEHSEWFWAREFEDSYKWLFEVNLSTDIEENAPHLKPIIFYPNPTIEKLYLQVNQPFENGRLDIYTIEGKIAQRTKLMGDKNQIDLQKLENGFYILKLTLDGQLVQTKRMVLAR